MQGKIPSHMDAGITTKVLKELEDKGWKEEFKKNYENEVYSFRTNQYTKELKGKSTFRPRLGINPPLVILIGGMNLTGKSTLAS